MRGFRRLDGLELRPRRSPPGLFTALIFFLVIQVCSTAAGSSMAKFRRRRGRRHARSPYPVATSARKKDLIFGLSLSPLGPQDLRPEDLRPEVEIFERSVSPQDPRPKVGPNPKA